MSVVSARRRREGEGGTKGSGRGRGRRRRGGREGGREGQKEVEEGGGVGYFYATHTIACLLATTQEENMKHRYIHIIIKPHQI